jgi:hypothetical protein
LLFCSYFIEAFKEGFLAVIVLGWLDFRELSDGDDLRGGDKGSFVDGLAFDGIFVNISFESMREIVFLEDHLFDMGGGGIGCF